MLAEIVRRAIEEQADMEAVIPRGPGRRTIDLSDIDVVVTAYDDQTAAVRMLRDHPELRVYALAEHGRESLLYELRPHRVALGEVSPGELIAHIREGRSDDETVPREHEVIWRDEPV
jgi:hypothetical protein